MGNYKGYKLKNCKTCGKQFKGHGNKRYCGRPCTRKDFEEAENREKHDTYVQHKRSYNYSEEFLDRWERIFHPRMREDVYGEPEREERLPEMSEVQRVNARRLMHPEAPG
ncbi:hypothetical protein [Candidatus Magnetobacterium casense]|uniref:Uncharacterized protein n=1 Tax=Candidatus Magnetobacterium casense TaxID=1455061 RepID=A0ABS6RZ53_9BACT|nr:hypothetical protein [Candidatus Magnetobacterium casensis]MBV6341058.1 hypothetical protein [Candidatus Magnetobacterium casensis]